MKAKTKSKSTKKIILTLMLGAFIGISVSYGSMVESSEDLNTSIERLLLHNCDCENVKSKDRGIGIEYTKENGLKNSQLEFTLINPRFNTSTEQEANRLNNILRRNIDKYDTIDLVTFNFQSKDTTQSVDIKINQTKN
ncbi:MAG: hypothetical protein ACTIJ9_06485 [Aequorivita sp.]